MTVTLTQSTSTAIDPINRQIDSYIKQQARLIVDRVLEQNYFNAYLVWLDFLTDLRQSSLTRAAATRQWNHLYIALHDTYFLSDSQKRRLFNTLKSLFPKEIQQVLGRFDARSAKALQQAYLQHRYQRGRRRQINCMQALMLGLGAAFSGEVKYFSDYAFKKAILDKVYELHGNKAEMKHMMQIVVKHRRATGSIKLVWQHGKVWKPDPLQTILKLMPPVPGWYFFGLALHTGYHCVLIAVDKTKPGTTKVWWHDQNKNKVDVSTSARFIHRMADVFSPLDETRADGSKIYKTYQSSELWKLIPDAKKTLNLSN